MDLDKIKIAAAPINWTNDDMPELGGEIPFEQCISEMALAGYVGCEVGNKYPRDTAMLKEALALRGLEICNQWFSYELTTKSLKENQKNFSKLLDFLEAMGAKVIGGGETGNSCQGQMEVAVFRGKGMLEGPTAWKDYCQKLSELGKMAYDRGMKLAFHHHMGTAIQSMEETERLMEGTDPRYVWLNYDCGHFTFAGEDAIKALEKFLPRTAHIHLKDIRPQILQKVHEENWSFLKAVKEGVFTVPGDPEGCIDYDALFGVLKKSEYEGWIVVEAEQDPARANPLKYAKMAREFIREKLGI
ncbi:MAG: myo-inosose-2 dehydratase [Bacteroidota bacterium]